MMKFIILNLFVAVAFAPSACIQDNNVNKVTVGECYCCASGCSANWQSKPNYMFDSTDNPNLQKWCRKVDNVYTLMTSRPTEKCTPMQKVTNNLGCLWDDNPTEGTKICLPGQYKPTSGSACVGQYKLTTKSPTKNPTKSPIDGVLSAWSTCTQTCGTGTKTRSCTTEAAYGGTACSTDLQQNCNTDACPAADSVEDAATSSTIAKKSSALKFGIQAVLIAGIFHFM